MITVREYHLASAYHLAAAVLGRAVLEEHLREWCKRGACVPAKNNATMNDDNQSLYGNMPYDKVAMQHMTAMAAVGNDASHNNPAVRADDVTRMPRDVRSFSIAHPSDPARRIGYDPAQAKETKSVEMYGVYNPRTRKLGTGMFTANKPMLADVLKSTSAGELVLCKLKVEFKVLKPEKKKKKKKKKK
jgi:hypothetical protein